MRLPRLIGFLTVLLAIIAPAQAQLPKPVTLTASVTPASAKVGDTVTVSLDATIDPKYHIYSIKPPSGDGPFPTKVTIEGAGLTPVGEVTESAPQIKMDTSFKIEVGSHYGKATFSRQFKVESASSGSIPIAASVRYQACTETSCLPPLKVEASPLSLAVGGSASASSPVQASKSSKPVTIAATVTPITARVGEVVAVSIEATIDPQYHTYSIKPVMNPSGEGPFATKVTIEGAGLTPVGEVTESTVQTKRDTSFNLDVGLHYGKATFTQYFRVDAGAKGNIPLKASVRYVACTDHNCLPPLTADATAPSLTIEEGPVRPEYSKPAVSGDASPTTPAPVEMATPTPTPKGSSGGMLGFILAAFGAGLLALITPCVFPMIPVTFAFFTKMATQSGTSVVKLASLYCLGIIITFTALGGIMAATVGAAGANRIAANPWVNVAFGALFIFFGLALLEVFEIQLPAALRNLTGTGSQKGGTLGVLFMGLTFVIAAFTCTAPFIGTVLVAAASARTGADWVQPIVGMGVFATALALPFFLLALFPGLLAKMPKSGAWLTTVKGTMGFIEIGAALKFLSNSDLVWQWHILTRPLMLALWTVIALAGTAWLVGILQVGFNTPSGKVTVGRGIGAGLFTAFAVYCMVGLTGRPLPGIEGTFVPPPSYGAGAGNEGEGTIAGLKFLKNDLDAATQQAKGEKKLVFVDFTGYTCTNCREMEQKVFPDAEVQAELKKFVRVSLFTDEENQKDPKDGQPLGPKYQEYQQGAYGDISLPLYAIVDGEGKPVRGPDGKPLTAAYNLDAKKFTSFLQEAQKAGSGL